MAAIDVEELFARTLEGDCEDDAPCEAVMCSRNSEEPPSSRVSLNVGVE